MKIFATKSLEALEKTGHIETKRFIFLIEDKIKDVEVEVVKYANFKDSVVNVKAITVIDRFTKEQYGFAYKTEETMAFLTNEDEERIKINYENEKNK